MNHVDSESPSDVARWLRSELTNLWPAFLGSLSLRRSRCIRKNCPACRSGEQHQSYVLYGRTTGVALPSTCRKGLCRRFSAAWTTGALCRISCHQAAPRYIKALKRDRAEASKQEEPSDVRATARQISFADWELMRQRDQGIRLEPLLEAISGFLDDQREVIERVRRDLVRDLKQAR
jgi:hypothetical protein